MGKPSPSPKRRPRGPGANRLGPPLEAASRRQAEAAEKKAPTRVRSRGGRRLVENKARGTTVTTTGRVALPRRSSRRPAREVTVSPLDRRLGRDESSSPRAARMGCRMVTLASFAAASGHLFESTGLRLGDETSRRACHRTARHLVRHRDRAAPRAEFAEAGGEVEFLADGVMAPTRDGWRGTKMAIDLERPLGPSAGPSARAGRTLPDPTIRVAYAAPTPVRCSPSFMRCVTSPRRPRRRTASRARRPGEDRPGSPGVAGRRPAGLARPHRGDPRGRPHRRRPSGRRPVDRLLRQAHRSRGRLRPPADRSVDRRRWRGGFGEASRGASEGRGSRPARRSSGRHGGTGRDGQHLRVESALIETSRLKSRIESYSRTSPGDPPRGRGRSLNREPRRPLVSDKKSEPGGTRGMPTYSS